MARKKRTDNKGYVLRVGEYQDKEAGVGKLESREVGRL